MKTYRIYQVDALNNTDAHILSYGRMFAPAIGIPEDPVTGNANGPLGAYLVQNGYFDQSDALYRSCEWQVLSTP